MSQPVDLYSDIALGECLIDGLKLSFQANADITKGKAVKLVAATNDRPKVDLAGSGDKAVGIALKTVSAGELCPVAMVGSVVKVTFGGAVSTGNRVMAGTVSNVKGYVVAAVPDIPSSYSENAVQAEIDKLTNAFGIALQDASTSGDTGLILIL